MTPNDCSLLVHLTSQTWQCQNMGNNQALGCWRPAGSQEVDALIDIYCQHKGNYTNRQQCTKQPKARKLAGWGLRVALAHTAHACLQWRHAPIKCLLEASRKLPSALIPCLAEVCWALWRLVKSPIKSSAPLLVGFAPSLKRFFQQLS